MVCKLILLFLKALHGCAVLSEACPDDHSILNCVCPQTLRPMFSLSPFLAWTISLWLINLSPLMVCYLPLTRGISSDTLCICSWTRSPSENTSSLTAGSFAGSMHCSKSVYCTQWPLKKYLLNKWMDEQMILLWQKRKWYKQPGPCIQITPKSTCSFDSPHLPPAWETCLCPTKDCSRKHRTRVWRSWRKSRSQEHNQYTFSSVVGRIGHCSLSGKLIQYT